MDTKPNVTDGKTAEEQELSPELQEVQNESCNQVHKRNPIHKNALYAGRLWRNTTEQVDPHRKTGFLQ